MWRFLVVLLLLGGLAGCGQPLVTPLARATRPAGATATRSPARATADATQVSVASSATPEIAPSAAPTAAPAATITLSPTTAPSPTPAVIITPQITAQTNEQRWRAQELNREVFDPPRLFVANSPVTLQWYDPVTGQAVEIGQIFGVFPAQAQFTLRDGNRLAFETPYRINNDFGLTAISDAVVQRMHAAGYQESVEAFVLQSDAIQPK